MEKPFKNRILLAISLLTLACVIVYYNGLKGEFVYDDTQQVAKNRYIQDLKYLTEVFKTPVWGFQDTEGKKGKQAYYRPIFILSYLLTHEIFGLDPFGFHLVNLLFHILVTILFLCLALKYISDLRFAFLAALIFAVHPIHTESVTWIAGLCDPLCALFVILGLLCYIRYNNGHLKFYYLLTAGCYLCAILSKETGIVFGGLLFFHDLLNRQLRSFKDFVNRYFILGLIVVLYFRLRIMALGDLVLPMLDYTNTYENFSIYNIFVVLVKYVYLTVLPLEFNLFHTFRPIHSINLSVAFSIAILGAMAYAAYRLYQRREGTLLFFGLFFFLFLAPVLSLKGTSGTIFAERYLYIPTLAYCLFLGFIANRSKAPVRTPYIMGLMLLLCLFFAFQTVTRNRIWRDEVTLFTDTLAKSEDALIVRTNLAVTYMSKKRFKEAINELLIAKEFIEAKKINLPQVYTNLGVCYNVLGNHKEALKYYQMALKLDPKDIKSIFNSAYIYSAMGDNETAVYYYQLVIQLDPQYEGVYFNLGQTYRELKRYDDSIAAFGRSVYRKDMVIPSLINIGLTYEIKGEVLTARSYYEKVLSLDPNNSYIEQLIQNAGKGKNMNELKKGKMPIEK